MRRWQDARNFGRRFPVDGRLQVAIGHETFLAAEHVARHFGFDVVLERTERALVSGQIRPGRPALLDAVLRVDVGRHQVRLFGLERAPVASVAGGRAGTERQRQAPVVGQRQRRFALESAPVARAPRQSVRIVLDAGNLQSCVQIKLN